MKHKKNVFVAGLFFIGLLYRSTFLAEVKPKSKK